MPDFLTLLFTDIEGSTRLWEQFPQAMSVALARHDAVLRRAITARGGAVFKTGGDAFYTVFPDSLQALRAAIQAQRTLQAETWPETTPLRVRMALHIGPLEHRDGDYFGPAANRAARLLAAGHGNQILVSANAAETLSQNTSPEWSLRDLGGYRLKDLARPEHIFQVVALGLPADFPPLRSLEAFAHNLPTQLTSFIGRERDVSEVRRLLMGPARLLTLAGMGGAGKTRLALQAASEAFSAFPDGVWFVDLAPIRASAHLPVAVAAALGLREEPGHPLLDLILDYIRPKQLLLILDNCEHLIEACAHWAETLLRQTSAVRLLATSREILNVPGETLYRLHALSAPTTPPTDQLDVPTLGRFEAVRLFVERAQTVKPNFTLTPANAPAIAEICAHLDGLPLAIELAAARTQLLTVEQIAARLDDRFRLLTGGSRTALPRQQTLQALVDWSYDLLLEPERAVFRRLAVCAGGWTLAIAEALTPEGAGPLINTLAVLESLVNKSLVIAAEQPSETRYHFLETLRQYALARLTEAGEWAAARAQHLAFFQAQIAQAAPHLRDADQLTWLAYCDVEHDNLRVALDWACAHQPSTALALCGGLWRWWYLRGLYREGSEWCERALAAAGPAPSRERVSALCGLAWLVSDFERRKALGSEAVAQARALGDLWLSAWALRGLGETLFDNGEKDAGITAMRESLALFEQTGETWGRAIANYNWGWMLCEWGDFVQAQTVWEAGLQLFRQTGDRWGIGSTLMALGNAMRVLGQYDQSVALMGECLGYFQALRDRSGEVGAMSFLGLVALRRGEYANAITMWEECLMIQQAMGNTVGEATTLGYLGWAQGYLGRYEKGQQLLREGLQKLPGSPPTLHYNNVGLIEFFVNHLDEAQKIWEDNLRRIRAIHASQSLATPLTGLALIAAQRGDLARAQALAEESLQVSREINEKRNIATSLHVLGQVCWRQGALDLALGYLRESLHMRAALQARRGMAACFESLAQWHATKNEWPPAAQLAGAADALRARLNIPIHPVEQPEHQQLIANGQTALGADWATHFTAGRRLSQAAALKLALGN
jgi:predicted ATPase/class 3 adenylate cyclase/Tfp pilus assembly protein PilF